MSTTESDPGSSTGRAEGATSRTPGPRRAHPVRHRVQETLRAHPFAFVAVKSAVAAGLAWLAVLPLGGAADDYPYYAPLGAVVVMSTTAMSSVRTSAQAVGALSLGAALGVVGMQLPLPGVLSLMVVVGIGTALSVWRGLGAMGVWVPFAALFVLILGGRDPWHYVLGYAGLTALGAAIGVAVNLAAPQLPLARTLHALTALRHELCQHLRALADHIDSGEGGLADQSLRTTSSLQPRARYLEELVSEAREARQVNWRAGRWRQVADEQEGQVRALERMTYLVDEVAALLSRSSGYDLAAGTSLGDATAAALRATAVMVEAGSDAYTPGEHDPSPYDMTRQRVTELRRRLLEHGPERAKQSDDVLIGAAVVVSLERALDAWS
jgi:uncharacterized membrane protein YgaE (UPF0421/DUF939 family)